LINRVKFSAKILAGQVSAARLEGVRGETVYELYFNVKAQILWQQLYNQNFLTE